MSQKELKKLPRKVADPDSIYKDNATGNLVFRYNIDKSRDAKVAFLPGHGQTSMELHMFFLESKDVIDNDKRYSLLWGK